MSSSDVIERTSLRPSSFPERFVLRSLVNSLVDQWLYHATNLLLAPLLVSHKRWYPSITEIITSLIALSCQQQWNPTSAGYSRR